MRGKNFSLKEKQNLKYEKFFLLVVKDFFQERIISVRNKNSFFKNQNFSSRNKIFVRDKKFLKAKTIFDMNKIFFKRIFQETKNVI